MAKKSMETKEPHAKERGPIAKAQKVVDKLARETIARRRITLTKGKERNSDKDLYRLRLAGKKIVLDELGNACKDEDGRLLGNLARQFLWNESEGDLWSSLIGGLSPSVLGQVLSAGRNDEESTSMYDVYPTESCDVLHAGGYGPRVLGPQSGITVLRELACTVIIARIWDILLEGLRK